jgi:hypothetical protein
MGKTILIVAFLVATVFIAVNRERIYLRDPLATVYRNNVEQSGVQVYMNYSDEILLEEDHGNSGPSTILLQDWNPMPGAPLELHCLIWTACMTTADRAPTMPIPYTGKGKYSPNLNMSNGESSFIDSDGAQIRITLR